MGEIRIDFVNGLNETPALTLAVRGWAEIDERGFSDGSMSVHASQHAFIAYAANGRDQLPVGVMTFAHDEDLKRVWVFVGYVIPEFRGQGIYNALWHRLVAHATELKVTSIQSGVHVRNSAMRAVAARQGRREDAVILRYDIGGSA